MEKSQLEMLRLEAVKRRTGMPKSTIYDRMAKGGFPKPRKIGPRAVAWLSSEIDDWMRSRPLAA